MVQPKKEAYVSSVLTSNAESIEQSLQFDSEKLAEMASTVLESSMSVSYTHLAGTDYERGLVI